MRILSYNILHAHPQFEGSAKDWAYRKTTLLELVRKHQADLIGIQEGTPIQIAELQAILNQHQYYGLPSKGEQGGEQAGIFFDAQQFKCLQKRTFWLSETPDKVSKNWNSAHPRICSYVVLERLVNGQIWLVLNTHLDHKSAWARREGTACLLREIAALKRQYTNSFVVLMGDFNAGPKRPPYQLLTQSEWLKDSFEAALQHGNRLTYSFTGIDAKRTKLYWQLRFFYPRYMLQRLDHIFVSSELTVLRHHIDDYNNSLHYPSDHLPVIVDLKV